MMNIAKVRTSLDKIQEKYIKRINKSRKYKTPFRQALSKGFIKKKRTAQ